MPELGKATFSLTADVGGFNSALDRAKDTATRFAGYAREQFRSLGVAIGVASTAVAGMLEQFAQKGVQTGAFLEKSTLQFETLMGSADAAKEHVKGLFDFAAKTPFETEPIIQASKMLQTFGGDALNSMDNLRLFGDAAAATTAPIQEVSFWVGRAYSSIMAGRPFGEAAMRLQELAILTPQARAQMEKLQKEGKSTNEVWALMTKDLARFNGAMLKQAETWEGLISTLHDVVNLTAAEVEGNFFKALKGVLKEIIAFQDSPAWTGIVSSLQKSFDKAAAMVDRFTKILHNLRTGGDVEAMGGLFGSIAGNIKALLPLLAGLSAGFAGMFLQAIPIVGRFASLLPGPVAGGLLAVTLQTDAGRDALKSLVGTFAELGKTVLPLISQVLKPFADLLGGTVLPALVNMAATIVKALTPALPPLANFLGQLAHILSDLFEAIMPPLTALLEKVAGVIADTLVQLLPVLTQLFRTLADILIELAPPLIQIASTLVDVFAPILPALGAAFGTLLLAIKPILDILTPLLKIIADLISSPGGLIALKAIIYTIIGLKLVGAVQGWVGAIGGMLNVLKGGGGLVGMLGQAVQAMKNWGQLAGTAVSSGGGFVAALKSIGPAAGAAAIAVAGVSVAMHFFNRAAEENAKAEMYLQQANDKQTAAIRDKLIPAFKEGRFSLQQMNSELQMAKQFGNDAAAAMIAAALAAETLKLATAAAANAVDTRQSQAEERLIRQHKLKGELFKDEKKRQTISPLTPETKTKKGPKGTEWTKIAQIQLADASKAFKNLGAGMMKALGVGFKQGYATAQKALGEVIKVLTASVTGALDDVAKAISGAINSGKLNNKWKGIVDNLRNNGQKLLSEVASLQAKMVAMHDAVVSGIQKVNMVQAFGSEPFVVPAQIRQFYMRKIADTKAFAAILKDLAGKGLNAGTLTELAQAGPDALGLARAIQQMGVGEVNAAQAQIASIAEQAGGAVTGTLYGKQMTDLAAKAKAFGTQVDAFITGLKADAMRTKANDVLNNLGAFAQGIKNALGGMNTTLRGLHVPGFAEGAIVYHPTFAKIAERGPEAVVPLDQLGATRLKGVGGGGNVIHFNDHTATPAETLRALSWLQMTQGA